MSTINITIPLDSQTVEFLDKLAVAEECDLSDIVRKAVTNVADLRRWQIGEIEKAVKEADVGLFLSDKDSAALMDELGR